MNINKLKIKERLSSIDRIGDFGKNPASKQQIEIFKERAKSNGVKESVINQLCDLYELEDSYLFDILIGFHSCTDEIIFEWWEYQELWIGQRDFNTIRWVNDKFCLGDAASISYSPNYEYDTLIGLIEGCIKEIREIENSEKLKFEEWEKVIDFYSELINKYHRKQEAMLVLIDKLKRLGSFSLFYPSTSHEALGLSAGQNYEERCDKPMVYIIYDSNEDNFKVHYQKSQGQTVLEKSYRSMILEKDIFEIQNWVQRTH